MEVQIKLEGKGNSRQELELFKQAILDQLDNNYNYKIQEDGSWEFAEIGFGAEVEIENQINRKDLETSESYLTIEHEEGYKKAQKWLTKYTLIKPMKIKTNVKKSVVGLYEYATKISEITTRLLGGK
jgi:hypothetical protein